MAVPGASSAGRFAEADELVEVATGTAFPGAVLAIGWRGGPLHQRAFGRLAADSGAPAVVDDTIYDLASLTKVVATTSVAMTLVDEGKLDLDAPVSALVPGFRGSGRDRVSARQLLSHSSGLPWWAPLYEEASGRQAVLERLLAVPLAHEPGARSVYSDLGMMLLGAVLERLGGAPLDALARERVTQPLGMEDTGYRPAPALVPRIAPTGHDRWRGRVLRGEVHDENAFAYGGVCGHAGLFGTATDLARLAAMLLDGGLHGGRRVVSRATVELFTCRAGVLGSTRALGWDTASDETGRRSSTPGDPAYSSAGSLLSRRSFGHTGFTGTSLWIDPERAAFVALLTNRVHLSRGNEAIRGVRARLADAVARAIDGR